MCFMIMAHGEMNIKKNIFLLKVHTSEMLSNVHCYITADVSKERTAFLFNVKQSKKRFVDYVMLEV